MALSIRREAIMFKVIEKNNMGISLSGIIDDVRGRLDDFLNQKRQVTPYHTNRASELGHRCLCYLYHCRANWDKRQPASSKQQSVYLEGLEQELSVIRLLLDLGFKIV